MKEFIEEHGRLPDNKINEDDSEKKCASWCDRQRTAYVKSQSQK